MTNARSGAPAPLSDPIAVHVAVAECLDALECATRAAYPSASNLTGDVGPTEAEARLTRLRVALEHFPDGHLPADPFTPPGAADPRALEVSGYPSIDGSSWHDAAIRFVAGVNDGMRVRITTTDPKTGEQFEAVEYPYARRLPSERGERWAMGPAVVPHFTSQPWSSDVWDKLRPALFRHAAALVSKGFFDGMQTRLRTECAAARNRHPAPPAGPAAGGTAERKGNALADGPPPHPKLDKPAREKLIGEALEQRVAPAGTNAEKRRALAATVTVESIAAATGIPKSTVGESDAWIAFHAERSKGTAKKPTPKAARQLTAKILAARPDPSARTPDDELADREDVEARYRTACSPSELARFDAVTPAERWELLDLYASQPTGDTENPLPSGG